MIFNDAFYFSVIPLFCAFLSAEWIGRLLLEEFYKPIETVGAAPGAIGIVIFAVLALVMLVLSMREKKNGQYNESRSV